MPDIKTRSPFGVWGLSLITFGIYYYVWAFKTCGEVQAVNPNHPDNRSGGNVVLSMLFGGLTLLIWPAINWFKFCGSVKAEQQAVGLQPTFNTGLATFLIFVASTHTCYVQSQRNLVVQTVKQRQGMPV
ncbi:DUF4234 domain-containing protein [Glycomyces tenuis]|uniref:DUF4234 domain-containing protein n=1 Tax=Glycomyces tenuis TaxID=58116 RepID=UPI00041FF4F6|nr:DUF4234 domain-containing protein [Glycomyces tenuis]